MEAPDAPLRRNVRLLGDLLERVLVEQENESLLEDVVQRSVRLRNPYVDPMTTIQVALLRRYRAQATRPPSRPCCARSQASPRLRNTG